MSLFATAWFPEIVARIFSERPKEEIWEWADRDNVFLDATMASEPGFYRSSKTPWTRRLQHLARRPYHNGRRVRKVAVKKSSQSGFTEAVLNCIRYFAKFMPRNVIYAINSATEALNIRERLVKTLESLGEEIFTGDADDLGRLKLTLRHMLVWFFGSYSAGSFANKQAPFCVSDEAEEHARLTGDTSTVDNLDSRMKDSDEGVHVVLSKPKMKGGVIDKEHSLGNQEIFLVPCPECGTYQELTLEKLVFSHCKTLLGEWDLDRVLREAYMKCEATYCGRPMTEEHKSAMVDNEYSRLPPMYGWLPTREGAPGVDPEVVSQHMSDLYSLSRSVSWGRIAIKLIQSKHDRMKRQGVYNHNLGLEWEEHVTKPTDLDVLRCKFAYRRSTIPWTPLALLLGSDVGKAYAKWAVTAIGPGGRDVAVIEWGLELHPDAIAHIVLNKEFPCVDGKSYRIMHGALDAKYRKEDTYAACMRAPLRLWPVMGGGGRLWTKSFMLARLPTFPDWLKMIQFNDRDFKTELYVVRIKREVPPGMTTEEAEEHRKTMPRLLVPENVDAGLIRELTNEHLEEDEESGEMKWVRKGPNEWGDCIKETLVLWRWLTRNRTPGEPVRPGPPAEVEEEEAV